jgi:hypothetical protein
LSGRWVEHSRIALEVEKRGELVRLPLIDTTITPSEVSAKEAIRFGRWWKSSSLMLRGPLTSEVRRPAGYIGAYCTQGLVSTCSTRERLTRLTSEIKETIQTEEISVKCHTHSKDAMSSSLAGQGKPFLEAGPNCFQTPQSHICIPTLRRCNIVM